MAINFASRSRITALLNGNLLVGTLDAAAGASRPDEVSGSSVTIESSKNLYRSDSELPTVGWFLFAGTDAPVPGLVPGATRANQLRVGSTHDRVEGFEFGIFARAGNRNNPLSGTASGNYLDISATNLKLETTDSDFLLYGEFSNVSGMPAGDGNTLQIVLRGATGSGARENQYAHRSTQLGTGNKLVLPGSSNAFLRTNRDINSAPPAQFFTSGR